MLCPSLDSPKNRQIMPRLLSISPISNEDTNALPIKELDPAIVFYQSMLGFTLTRRDTAAATLERDGVRVRLVINHDHQPGGAGSLAFAVDDLDGLHRELFENGGKPGEFGIDEWDGKQHRTFFVREEENGYCYCFYCLLETSQRDDNRINEFVHRRKCQAME